MLSWLKFEILSEDRIAIKVFKVEMYRTEEGSIQMSDEEQVEDRVQRSCAVICWSQPDQTGHLLQTLSVITEPDIAPFFLRVSFMATTECTISSLICRGTLCFCSPSFSKSAGPQVFLLRRTVMA